MDTPTIAELVGNLGGLGVVVGLVWYLITKTLPRRDERFEKSLDRVQERFAASLNTIQNCHQNEITELAASVRHLADRVEKNTRVVLGVSMRGVPPDERGESTSELARVAGVSRPVAVQAIRSAARRARRTSDDTDTIALATVREILDSGEHEIPP